MSADTIEAPAAQLLTVVTDQHTGQRTYTYPPTGEELISVTSVTSGTTGMPWMGPWYLALAAQYAARHAVRLAAMTPAEIKTDITKAVKAETEVKADAGTHVHKVAELLILWASSPGRTGAGFVVPPLPAHLEDALYEGEPVADVIDGMVDGFLRFITDWEPEFLASELVVFNPDLGYAGTLDMILAIRDAAIDARGRIYYSPGSVLTILLDLKTGRRMRAEMVEQVAALDRCPEAWIRGIGRMAVPPPADHGGILRCHPDLRDGYELRIVPKRRLVAGWNRFRDRLRVHREIREAPDQPGPVSRPVSADDPNPSPYLDEMQGEGYPSRALTALARHMGTVADLAHYTPLELAALRGVGPKTVKAAEHILADHQLAWRNNDGAVA